MDFTTPHFLLSSRIDRAQGSGQWQFVLRTEDGYAAVRGRWTPSRNSPANDSTC